MFRRLDQTRATVTITVDGAAARAAPGDSVAAVLFASGNPACRKAPFSGSPRAPFCLIGQCFDCLVEIDGIPNRQACLESVREGMIVRRQR